MSKDFYNDMIEKYAGMYQWAELLNEENPAVLIKQRRIKSINWQLYVLPDIARI